MTVKQSSGCWGGDALRPLPSCVGNAGKPAPGAESRARKCESDFQGAPMGQTGQADTCVNDLRGPCRR